MKEKDYFNKSKKEKLSLRCPILGKCERYMQTVFILKELNQYGEGLTMEDRLRNRGYLSENYEKEKVNCIGEPFEFSMSNDLCFIRNACPEVSLFENEGVFGFIPRKAIRTGSWDNFWKDSQFGEDKKFRIDKIGHFSECLEFSQYHYQNKVGRTRRRTGQDRKPISKQLRFEIFQRDKFTCQYCGRNSKVDGVKLQIDHIVPISKGGKDEVSNLTTSCEDCNLGKSNKSI